MQTENRTETALITGASSGIGRALAKEFANHGFNVVLVARDLKRLEQTKIELGNKISTKIIPKDLADPEAPEEVYKQIREDNITIDVLVNCAGFGLTGEFAKTDIKRELEMLQVNVVTLTYLTKLFLIDMVRRGNGKVLNVASTAGFEPGPFMSVYHATKAYVLYFSEAIAEELKGSSVTVTTLCPGPTRTGFDETAGNTRSKLFTKKSFINVQSSKEVASEGYKGLMRGHPVVISGFTNKLVPLAVKFLPRRMLLRIVKEMYKDT